MSYATLSDVLALAPARILTATSKPATSQVGLYLDQTAAVLDSILVEKGYSLPIPTSASSALLLLRKFNAEGAWAEVERVAEASQSKDQAEAAWEAAQAMLRSAGAVLDIPKQTARSRPRGPGLTTPNGVAIGATLDPNFPDYDSQGNPVVAPGGVPFFGREMQF